MIHALNAGEAKGVAPKYRYLPTAPPPSRLENTAPPSNFRSRLRHFHLDLRRRGGACGGGWLLLFYVEEDAAADADAAAAERKHAANCERGTRRAAQDQQGGTPVALRAACERGLDNKGVAHPRRR